jgi:predicted TIM-barrel fold metal-dependent hydrolase
MLGRNGRCDHDGSVTDTPANDSVDPQWDRLRALPLSEYVPTPQVVLPRTVLERPSVPAIDVHNHLGRWLSPDWMTPDVTALLQLMDAGGVSHVVNLDGRWGDELSANVARYDTPHPLRFTTFCHVQWARLAEPGAPADLVTQLEDSHRRGAIGVKVWKDLGLNYRDERGELVLPGDERVVTVLRRAGELGMPVLIHTADPVAFFEPLDEHNERLDELSRVPEWWFGDRSRYPTFDALLASLEELLANAPDTTFIGAHVGCYAENLTRVSQMLDRYPNFNVDLGGRIAELGRQPRAFARLVSDHPDQVLFGTDAFPLTAEALQTAYRFLETDDEHFDYAPGVEIPPQGRWAISGAALPPDHLAKVYRDNATRVLGL